MAAKYLILIVEPEWEASDNTPEAFAEEMQKHAAFAAAVAEAGCTVVSGEALEPTSNGFSIVPGTDDADPVVTPGPVIPRGGEAFTGYYVIETDTPEQARELAALCPTGGHIEVRPVWDMVGE
ncbi:hypothetical protein BH09ACT1_BH09ACT1_09460 [soil metagenome]